ncbi:MAG: SMI1/KNR4 family protein [Meiothermus sp.]|nr:SMI1/KNR4 family protein [Meiothermus sp.]
MTLREVKKAISGHENVEFSGKVAPEQISLAQERLGVRFPPQYTEFLSEFGCGGVGSEKFFGLGSPKHLDVVETTLWLRNRFAYTAFSGALIPIRADGFGDCIDTDRPTANGEYMISFWSHESRAFVEDLAPSYFEWMMGVLELARN